MFHCTVFTLFGSAASFDGTSIRDGTSMLQMPVVQTHVQTDQTDDTDECRCPGYFQEQCEAEAAQGCIWTDAGSSNEAWCQCRSVPEPPRPDHPERDNIVCCQALTASCLACSASVSVDDYCANNPGTSGCPNVFQEPEVPEPEEPVLCCRALTASCLACSARVSVDEYCLNNPRTSGCPNEPEEPVLVSGQECCVASPPSHCAGVRFPRAIVDAFTTDFTQIGVVFAWQRDACFETHTDCCPFNTVECAACQASVQPDEFCALHGDERPELCLTGEDCCVESPPAGCSGVDFARALGHGMTTDFTQVASTHTWFADSNSCHSIDIFCCQDRNEMDCVACRNGVQPEDFCEQLGSDYPQFCLIIVEPPPLEECCGRSVPDFCQGIDIPLAVGDGFTTDYREVRQEYVWNGRFCLEDNVVCCWMDTMECAACQAGVLPSDFCAEVTAENSRFCLTGEECCAVNPPEGCDGVRMDRASAMTMTFDFNDVANSIVWDPTSKTCLEEHTVCCHEHSIECQACLNGVRPEDFCFDHIDEFNDLCEVTSTLPECCLENAPRYCSTAEVNCQDVHECCLSDPPDYCSLVRVACEIHIFVPPDPSPCCADSQSRPDYCALLDFAMAIGDGYTTDYREVGRVFEWHEASSSCFDMNTNCCWMDTMECDACHAGVLPQDFCGVHPESSHCLTGEECCSASPPEGCGRFPWAVGHGFTTDYTEVGKVFEFSHGACHEMDTLCCHDSSRMECVACMNSILPADYCASVDDVDLCGFPSPAVIRNAHNGRRLFAQSDRNHENGFGAGNGETIFDDQKWIIEDAGTEDGAYTITNFHSGRRIFAQAEKHHEDGVGADNGDTVHADQKWLIERQNNHMYIISNYHSGRRLFAQAQSNHEEGVGAANGGRVYADQMWYIDAA